MKKIILLTLILICLALSSMADIPKTIHYQGRLTNLTGNPVDDGTYSVVIRFYDVPTGGTYVWSEPKDVVAKNGYFNAVLGDTVSFTGSGFDVDFNQQYYVGIKVGTDSEMTPRTQLNSAAYAMNVSNGAITMEKIADHATSNQWVKVDDSQHIWNTTGEQLIMSQSITLAKDTAIMVIATCNYSYEAGTEAIATQFRIDAAGLGGDNAESYINPTLRTQRIALTATAGLAAGTHTINMNLSPVILSPGHSFKTNRHKIFIIALYK